MREAGYNEDHAREIQFKFLQKKCCMHIFYFSQFFKLSTKPTTQVGQLLSAQERDQEHSTFLQPGIILKMKNAPNRLKNIKVYQRFTMNKFNASTYKILNADHIYATHKIVPGLTPLIQDGMLQQHGISWKQCDSSKHAMVCIYQKPSNVLFKKVTF